MPSSLLVPVVFAALSPTTVTGNSRLVAFIAGDGTIGVSLLNNMLGLSLQFKNAQTILPDVFTLVKSITSCRLETPPSASEFAIRFVPTDPLYWMCVTKGVTAVCRCFVHSRCHPKLVCSRGRDASRHRLVYPLCARTLHPQLRACFCTSSFSLSPRPHLLSLQSSLLFRGSMSARALNCSCRSRSTPAIARRHMFAAPAPASLSLDGHYSDWLIANPSNSMEHVSMPATCSFATLLAGGKCHMQYTYPTSLFGVSSNAKVRWLHARLLFLSASVMVEESEGVLVTVDVFFCC